MVEPHRQLAITFNGEIYNYRELRRELESNGYRFRTDSDTEVLLHLYAERGAEMVRELRGMFAFALWDGLKRGLLLARDHFGIKPLYMTEDSTSIRVASEVKALLRSGGIDTAPDPAGHVGFFLWGHVPEPYTLYRGIRALPAGCTLWIDGNGDHALRRYASLDELFVESENRPRQKPGAVLEELRTALLESVNYHLVADVEIGVFLSAGLDSSTLTALASEIVPGRLRTITLGFEEYRDTDDDETVLAEAVARHYGTAHTTSWVTRRDFDDELTRLLDRMDQPSIDGINTYFVARAASQCGLKVAISGLGGDELFGGYPSFRQIPRLVSFVRRIPASALVGRAMRTIVAPLLKQFTSPKYAGLVEYGGDVAGAYLLRRGLFLPWELEAILDRDVLNAGLTELQVVDDLRASTGSIASTHLMVSALEAAWYMRNQLLRDTDWASMSHSVEVRVPLVDWKLWQTVSSFGSCQPSTGKELLAATPKLALPASLLHRRKTGFQVPTREWIATAAGAKSRGLRGWAQRVYETAA